MNRDGETKNEHFRDLARYHADFFHERRDQNRLYLIKFLTYEFLNLIALIIVFVMTDKFLGNYFHSYGAEVISDALKEDGVKINHYDAKCNAFPTLVSISVLPTLLSLQKLAILTFYNLFGDMYSSYNISLLL